MKQIVRRVWTKIHQPRVISTTQSLIYLVLLAAGTSALIDPPRSIEGEVGSLAMNVLAGMLVLGGVIGVPTALFGYWWFERAAVFSVCTAALIYGVIIVSLHITGEGNRLVQLGFVLVVLIEHLARGWQIRFRPRDPSK